MTPDIIKQIAFVTGRILHRGTGRPVDGKIRLKTKQGPVTTTIREDGIFAVSGNLDFLFPDLATQPYAVDLTIRADSAQFREGFIEQALPIVLPMGLNLNPVPPASPDPMPDVGTIFLPGDPINIRGRVTEGANLGTPIAGAQIDILHPGPAIAPALTDADGFYRIDGATVFAPAQIRASELVNFKDETRTLLPDFGLTVNEENFRLAPI
jgi:hypothetical protein